MEYGHQSRLLIVHGSPSHGHLAYLLRTIHLYCLVVPDSCNYFNDHDSWPCPMHCRQLFLHPTEFGPINPLVWPNSDILTAKKQSLA